MTKINAQVVADSISPSGDRITTMLVTMPRMILAEFNTHRMFSRNTSSSRAIPFEKMVESIETDPFIPVAWQREHKGMQGTDYITDPLHIREVTSDWLEAMHFAINAAKRLNKGFYEEKEDRVTKQLCNRLLEPFMWCTVLVTATEWENFFSLRAPQYETINGIFRSKKDAINSSPETYKDAPQLHWLQVNKGQAEIHMMALAEAMWDAYNESVPKELKAGEWHIPFEDQIKLGNLPDAPKDDIEFVTKLKVKVATAMAARTSYTVVGSEGKVNYENDIKLHDRLLEQKHMSPFEHCAMVPEGPRRYQKGFTMMDKDMNYWSGNFKGWIQYRQLIES